jgi:hypothetical protein
MNSDYTIVDILRNNRIVKGVSAGITTLAAFAAFTFGSMPAVQAGQTKEKPSIEKLVSYDAEDDIAPVPLVSENEKKKKKDNDALELVPLVPPTIKKHKLRLPKPFSAFEIQPLIINVVNGEFNPDRGRYTGRLDLNKDGTLDYTLFMEKGDKPDTFQVWLGEIATSKPVNAQTVRVHNELGKIIAGWRGSGTRNFYVMGEYSVDPVFSISGVKGIESILLPNSIAESKVRGYDKVDDRIACHLKKGCMLIQNVPDSELIKVRQLQIKNYFAEAKEIIEEDIMKTRDGGFRRGELYSKKDYETYILHIADEAVRRFEIYNKIVGDAPISRLGQIACNKYVRVEKEKMLDWILNYTASDEKLVQKRKDIEEKKVEKKPDKKPDTYVRKIKEPDYKLVGVHSDPKVEVPEVLPIVATESREFYETWWFWTAVGVVVIGGAVAGGILGSQGGGEKERPDVGNHSGDGHIFTW